MATDIESRTDKSEIAQLQPSLKIAGIHIRGLKSIGSLDLPKDGLGWDGPIPDFVMIGGINGSGKSALLEFLAGAAGRLADAIRPKIFEHIPEELQAEEARIDFRLFIPEDVDEQFCFLVGDHAFFEQNRDTYRYGLYYDAESRLGRRFGKYRFQMSDGFLQRLQQLLPSPKFAHDAMPRVVYFPSERRTSISPKTNHKSAGKLEDRPNFVDRWTPPESWDASLESRLYGARWEDLNAKEEGRIDQADRFDSYARAFNRFFEGRKRLRWHMAELVVETKGGATHDLAGLSSGEKQMILFMGELLHRWRPGSLILIDEPELHLHESYQTKLWESLIDWQKERGGQVIVATQSAHLFSISEPGIKVLLGGRRAR